VGENGRVESWVQGAMGWKAGKGRVATGEDDEKEDGVGGRCVLVCTAQEIEVRERSIVSSLEPWVRWGGERGERIIWLRPRRGK
jgi:hypothetical protein